MFRKTPAPRKSPGKAPGRSGRGKRKRLWILGRLLRLVRYAFLAFLATSVAGVLLFRFVPVPFTPLMLIRLAGQASEGAPLRLEKSWRPLERISPHLAEAVVAAEDQRFPGHHGFDWEAIGSAFTANGRGKRKLGASTISQQTAKNLFLWPDRTWLRKGMEAYFTLLIESLWPKRRILEVYLNIIETGDGTYGAQAAARRWFKCDAEDLTAPQAALIAASLPNPRAWSPARPTGYLIRRQTWILRQMGRLGPLPWDKEAKPSRPAAKRPTRPPGNARDTLGPPRPPPPSAPTLRPPAPLDPPSQPSGPPAAGPPQTGAPGADSADSMPFPGEAAPSEALPDSFRKL